jgi:hypothetical protein
MTTPENDDREARAREAIRRMIRNAAQLLEKETSRKFYRARMEVENVETLVALAREGDKDALDLLREYARGARRHAQLKVPRALHEFVWEIFVDGPPPAKSGLSPKDMGLKHLTIALMVKMVTQDFGFPQYRNTEHRGEKGGPISACLLVAEEIGLAERTVEEILASRKASVLRAP